MGKIKDRRRVLLNLGRKYGWNCHWCGRETIYNTDDYKKQPSNKATIEHLVPLSRGGENKYRNFRIACYRCNNARGSRPEHLPVTQRVANKADVIQEIN